MMHVVCGNGMEAVGCDSGFVGEPRPAPADTSLEGSDCQSRSEVRSQVGSIFLCLTYYHHYNMFRRPFVMYVLEVEYSGTHWTVARRYSDFVSLHHKVLIPPRQSVYFSERLTLSIQLKEAVPHFRGSLPKKTFFNNLKRWFIEQRRMDLHRYLVQVQFNRSCIDSDVWTRFLVPVRSKLIYLFASSNHSFITNYSSVLLHLFI